MKSKAWEIKANDQAERGRVNSLQQQTLAKGPKAGTKGTKKSRTVKPGSFAGVVEAANTPDDILKAYSDVNLEV